ncbi:MAG: hypothetical protein ACFFCT_05160 [Candidatus Odinarchaeota archaeon]
MRQSIHLPVWLRLLLKALLVMLVPLQFNIRSGIDILFLPLNGLLFTPSNNFFIYFAEQVTAQPILMSDIMRNFLMGVFLAFPAISFNYRLMHSPADKPFRNLAIGIMILSSFMIFMAELILMPIFNPVYYYNYQLIQNIQIFPTFVIGAFVILPMIQRQAVIIASPEELHSHTMREIEMNPQLRVRREKFLATILWIALFFLPYFVFYQYTFYNAYAAILSFSYTMNINSGIYVIIDIGSSIISGMGMPFFYLPILGILGAVRFLYVRDIYRYLKHEITHRRMMFMGILGDIFPIIGYIVISILFSPWSLPISSIFPLPFLFFIGVLLARLHRSVLPYGNRIWADVDTRMWFEEQETRPIIVVPEKPYRPSEEQITVPFGYMVISHIRKRRHNNHSRHDNED